jgi:tRNA1Val (adenine37-N6)-methyltransferase
LQGQWQISRASVHHICQFVITFAQKSGVVANDYFRFKHFTIWQDRTAMKVGTDGVLLGAWADPVGAKTILDVGTGTGLLALMMAQRSQGIITALELEKGAFLQAKENIQRSPWQERIVVLHLAFQDYYKKPLERHDMIITNPPYFKNSLESPTQERTLARHNQQLTHGEILEGSLRLLKPQGKLNLILPYEAAERFTGMAAQKGLYCTRRTSVYPRAHKKPARALMEFGFTKETTREGTLVIEKEQRHQFTDAYQGLTRNFYLNF